MIITKKAYPRAALIGNPSDGYFGKTIAFVFKNFEARVTLQESERLEIIPQERDKSAFYNLVELVSEIQNFGYYGGIRLIKAGLKKFYDYCQEAGKILEEKNCKISYHSNIPNRLGLAGSSAIITALMKALMEFYAVEIPKPILANLVLAAELEELKIGAGLQDRVAQVYETPVFMDFDKKIMTAQGYGNYETLDTALLANIYIAYKTDLSEGSEVVHNNLRERFDAGDAQVVEAMHSFGQIAHQAKKAMLQNDEKLLADLMNQNFDLRASICQISSSNFEMIKMARTVGASAKFTGSGGAIIGIYENEKMLEDLRKALSKINARVIIPEIATS